MKGRLYNKTKSWSVCGMFKSLPQKGRHFNIISYLASKNKRTKLTTTDIVDEVTEKLDTYAFTAGGDNYTLEVDRRS